MSSGRFLVVAIIAVTLSSGGARLIAQRAGDTLPQSVGDLTVAQLVEIRDHGGQVLLHGTLKTSKNEPNETERKADLVSPTGQKAKGKVDVDIERKDGIVAKQEFVVTFEKLPAMTECELFIDGRHVSSFTTPKGGKTEVKLERKSTIER